MEDRRINRVEEALEDVWSHIRELQVDAAGHVAHEAQMMSQIQKSIDALTVAVRGDDNGRLGLVRRQDQLEKTLADVVRQMGERFRQLTEKLAAVQREVSAAREEAALAIADAAAAAASAKATAAAQRAGPAREPPKKRSPLWKTINLMIQNWPGILTGLAAILAQVLGKGQ